MSFSDEELEEMWEKAHEHLPALIQQDRWRHTYSWSADVLRPVGEYGRRGDGIPRPPSVTRAETASLSAAHPGRDFTEEQIVDAVYYMETQYFIARLIAWGYVKALFELTPKGRARMELSEVPQWFRDALGDIDLD